MTKEGKERVRKILGEGKLYEVQLYGGRISVILTNEKDFDFDSNFDWWHAYFFQDVSDRIDSSIISEIHDIFQQDIKILGYCDFYSSLSEGCTVFKKKTFNYDTSYITDKDCNYLVCTPNKKSKVTKWNTNDDYIEIV